jgi:TP901 family phage tail tape measure protein
MGRSGALAASEMSRLQNNFMNAVNRSGQFDARMKTIKTTTESFTESLEKNKLSMGQYFRYAGAATKDFGKLFKGEFDTIEKVARERVKDLQTQYIKMGRDANGAMKAIAVRPLMLDMDDLGTKTQIAAQKQQLLNQLLKQGSTNMLNWGKNTQWAGRQLMVGFTVPLTMLGQIAAKTFMDMEQSVLKFQRVYGDFSTTTQQTKDMTAEVTNLAKAFTKYGVAVSDTVGMAADAAAMGKQGKDLIAQVESASRLSILGGIDQKQALETTISLTNAFGISADQLRNKINFLNVVENQTVTSIDDLTIAIPKAAPVIKQLGGSVEDLAFFLTAMKEGGINASEGANALKSGIASIINPTKKASDMLAGFGINIKGIVENNKGDVRGMVMGVAEALNTLDPLKRAQAIEQLFGKFQFARISTLFKNITDVNSQASQVAKLAAQGPEASAILAQRELKKIEDSPMFKFKKALEDLKVELIPLGQQFLQAVTPIAKFFSDILKNFNSLGSGTKDTIGLITGLVAGIGPLALMVIGLIANGIANMIKLFASVKSFFNNLGKGTQDLGSQTAYMTQEQIDAQAVAASLNQTHSKLTQTFTSEAGAIGKLRAEMEKAVAVQNQFNWSGNPANAAKPKRAGKKMATGGVVVGPGGPKDDKVPTNLSNGEVVLSVDNVRKNPAVVAALLSGAKVNIPGYANNSGGPVGEPKPVRTHMSMPFAAGTPQYAKGLEDSGFGGLPEKLHKYISVVSNLVVELPHSLNILLENGTASIAEFSSTWSSRAGKLYETARKGGADVGDPLIKAAIDDIEKQIHDKAIALANGGPVSDPILAQAAEHVIESQVKSLDKSMATAAGALKNRKDSVGQVRFSMPTEEARGMLASGEAVKDKKTTAITVGGIGIGRLSKSGMEAGQDEQTAKYYGANPYRPKGGYSSQSIVSTPIDLKTESSAVPKAEGKKTAKKKAEEFDAGLIEQGQVQSPSRVTKEIGANYGKGFIIGAKEALQTPVASPAAMQHARDQVAKMLKPYTDPQGLINTEKLNRAYQVQVHVLTENEKALRQGIQMMKVARMPQDMFWKAVDKTGQVASAVGTAIKSGTVTAIEALKNGVIDLGNKAKLAAIQVKDGAVGLGQKIKGKWQDQVDPKTGQVVKEGWKTQMKNNLRGGGGVMAIGALAGAATQLPGKAGEVAGQLAAPVTAAASAMMMLPGPIGMVLGGLIGLATVVGMVNAANEKANKAALDLGTSMASTNKKVKAFGEATGRVSATEIRQAQQDNRVSGLRTTNAQDDFAKQFIENSDAGKQLLADAVAQKEGGRSSDQIGQNISVQLGMQIAEGTITVQEAKALAKQIGDRLKDQRITAVIAGQVDTIMGPNGENLAKDPLKVTMQLTTQAAQTGTQMFNDSTYGGGIEPMYIEDPSGSGNEIPIDFGGLTNSYMGAAANAFNSTGYGYINPGPIDPEKKGQAKTSAQLGIANYGAGQQALDVLNQQYDAQIAEKEGKIAAATGQKKIDLQQELVALEQERTDAIVAQNAANQTNYSYLVGQKKALEDSGINYNEDVFKTAVTSRYENDPVFKNIAGDVANNINGIDTTGGTDAENTKASNFQTRLQVQFAGGAIDPTLASNLFKLGEGDHDFQLNYDVMVSELGDAKSTELVNGLAAAGATGTAIKATVDLVSKDPAKFQSTMDSLAWVNSVNGTSSEIDINVNGEKGQAALATFRTEYDRTTALLKTTPKGKIALTAVSDPKVAKLIEQSQSFKKLNKSQQIKYVASYNATMALKGNPAVNDAWVAWAKKHKGSDVTFPAFARYMAGEAAASAAPSSTDSSTSNNSNTGSAAPTKTDKANAALSILGRKEEKINKAYDERLKALDAIQKANDKINQQQKDQLDLADALSRGDIGAAARAQQQARQNAQATALQEQRDNMSAARDAQIASLRVNGMSREGLENFINKESDKSDKKTLKGWHYATGGMVPKTQYFALGGQPRGTDTIAAMLTPGEFVVKKSAVDALGAGTMNKINSGKLPGGGHSMYNYSVNINVKSDADADQIAKTVIAEIHKIDNQAMKGNNA